MAINGRIEAEFPLTCYADAAHLLGTLVKLPDVMDSGKKQEIVNDGNWEQVQACF